MIFQTPRDCRDCRRCITSHRRRLVLVVVVVPRRAPSSPVLASPFRVASSSHPHRYPPRTCMGWSWAPPPNTSPCPFCARVLLSLICSRLECRVVPCACLCRAAPPTPRACLVAHLVVVHLGRHHCRAPVVHPSPAVSRVRVMHR